MSRSAPRSARPLENHQAENHHAQQSKRDHNSANDGDSVEIDVHCLSPHSRKRTNRLDNAVPPDLTHPARTDRGEDFAGTQAAYQPQAAWPNLRNSQERAHKSMRVSRALPAKILSRCLAAETAPKPPPKITIRGLLETLALFPVAAASRRRHVHLRPDRPRRHGEGLAEPRYQDDSCVCDCGVRDNAHQSQRCRRRWRCCGHACFVGRHDILGSVIF